MENLQSKKWYNNNKKIFLLAAFVSVLVVTIVSITVVKSHKNDAASNHSGEAAVVKSTCAATLYPELCISTIKAAKPSASAAIKSSKDVLITALKYTIHTVGRNHFSVTKIRNFRKSLTPRVKAALHDCLEVIADTLEELHDSEMKLKDYGLRNYSLADHKEILMTLLSAAQTNQQSCLDGFSHDKAGKKIRQALIAGQTHVFRLVSNVLAIIKNMTDTEMASNNSYNTSPERKLGEDIMNSNDGEWPNWLSAGDRRLLQASSVTPDVTVAADGSGNYRTVSQAVAAAPSGSSRRYVIRIKAGVYRENVEVPRSKNNLMFVGDGRMNTIITGRRNVVDGSTTFNSATVAIVGGGFLARDITFENTAGPSKEQAVALRVNADLSAFYRCNMLAYQDTLYVHSLRQFYTGCTIVGTVDFIFGNAAAVLQDCDIRPRRPNAGQKNMVTAQSRDDPNQNTGIVIQKCKIRANSDLQPVLSSFPSYLGRPWKMYSRTVVMQTEISNVIHPAGWFEWDGNFALDTLFYAEYQNTGAGSGTGNRVTWRGFRVLTSASQAQPFTAGPFIGGGNWLPATGFPYSLGL